MAPRKASKQPPMPEGIEDEAIDDAEDFEETDEDGDGTFDNDGVEKRTHPVEALRDTDDNDMPRDYHTDPEYASASPETDSRLLPAELLKSKPATEKPAEVLWEQLSRSEKKAIRDERGVSMKKLREQAKGTGVIEAGRAAQEKRGIQPADKVAGSRVSKRKRKGKRDTAASKKPILSGRQQVLANRQNNTQRPLRKRKG